MKNKTLAVRRPQDAMVRFDRLLAAMAPKAEAPVSPTAPKRPKKKSPTRDTKPSAR